MILKNAQTGIEINTLSQKRWSPRAFDSTREISLKQIKALSEAARWTQSAFNEQPWIIFFADKFKTPEAWEKVSSTVNEWNRRWALNAPILVVVAGKKTQQKNGEYNRWYGYDTGAAANSICLEAVNQGLVTHQMGGFDENLALEVLRLNDDYSVFSVIALGFQAEINVLDLELQKRELLERNRKPLSANFYLGFDPLM